MARLVGLDIWHFIALTGGLVIFLFTTDIYLVCKRYLFAILKSLGFSTYAISTRQVPQNNINNSYEAGM